MYTFQDFEKIKDNEKELQAFIFSAIISHKGSDFYKEAWKAKEYFEKRNVTISKFQKWLYKVTGEKVPDTISPNHKVSCGFFPWFIIQQNEYLLSNGVTFSNNQTKEKLGGNIFDDVLKFGGEAALWGGVSFGFYNLDRVQFFNILEFVPLYDEETGALKAGIYFWQIDKNKPLRATLYEIDGYTDYLYNLDDSENGVKVLAEKRPYILKIAKSDIGGIEILDGKNHPSFPIVPFWGNPEHQSELVGLQELIDSYDLILSGYANTIDETSDIFWVLANADGMDEIDAINFKDMVKRTKVALDGAEPHTIDIPSAARENILEQLRTNLYVKFGAFDTKEIYSGGVTATAIDTAYDNLDKKADRYEGCVTEFINGLLSLIGVDDAPTYQRSAQKNKTEEIDNILKSAQYLSESYITKKILTILGDIDQYEAVMQEMQETERGRFIDAESGNQSGRGESEIDISSEENTDSDSTRA